MIHLSPPCIQRALFSALIITSFFSCAALQGDAAEVLHMKPSYASYAFDKSGKTIYFGMQPLFTPDGVVQSVMRRDTVLAKALREKGLTLKFYPFHKGIDINYFMKRGDIDIGMAGESPVMSASATSDMVIAALMQQGASAVVAPKRITTLRGLKGRRIGYPEGSTADLGLLIAFSAIGLDEQSVTLVPMEIANLLPALENGQIDAFSAWEPLVSHALADNTNRSAVSKFLVSSFLYMNRSFLERNPYAAEQIAAAAVRAVRWLQASDRNLSRAVAWNLAEADAFLGRPSGMKPEVIKKITARDLLRFGDPAIPERYFAERGYLHRMFLLLQEKGRIDRVVAWERIRKSVNMTLLDTILSAPGRYRLGTFEYDLR